MLGPGPLRARGEDARLLLGAAAPRLLADDFLLYLLMVCFLYVFL